MDTVTTDYTILEQCLGSLIRYIQIKAGEDTTIYLDEIPEDLFVPSIYFPVPRTTVRRATFQSWLITIHMDVWFLASNSWLAYANAIKVREAILYDGCAIKLLDIDGEDTGNRLRLTEPEVSNQDFGMAILSFGLKEYAEYRKDKPMIDVYNFTGIDGGTTVLKAWEEATQELREKEKEDKLWLQKAARNLQQN